MITTTLRINLALPGQDPATNAARHQAAVAMAERADAGGLTAVSLEEHHGVCVGDEPLGWLASPTTMAAAILARTRSVTVGLWGIALPLHDPVRLAEDIATLDLLAPGRVVTIVNTGYREHEFAAHGQSYTDRAALFDHKLGILIDAWSGRPFDIGGRSVVVTPRPVTQPHPMLMIGGTTEADADRAARHGLPFRPSADDHGLRAAYEEACAEADTPVQWMAPPAKVSIVQVAADPDEWWERVGPHLLLEARVYAGWMTVGERSAVRSGATTVDELRAEGIYAVLTPAQCVDHARATGAVVVHPLCGGTPLDLAWQTFDLFVDAVLPELTA